MNIQLAPRWTITEHGQKRGFTSEGLGFIPYFLNALDTRPAAKQIDANYDHGGGWRPMGNGKWSLDPETHRLTYDCGPDDEDEHYLPLATCRIGQERLYFYDCAWTAIVQPNGSFEVARLD